MLNTSGLTAEVVDDIHSTEWTKLLGAVPGLIMSSLTRLELYEMWMNRHLASMWVQLLKETAEVAKKDGARLTMIPGMELFCKSSGKMGHN